jgi:hypothetical protein
MRKFEVYVQRRQAGSHTYIHLMLYAVRGGHKHCCGVFQLEPDEWLAVEPVIGDYDIRVIYGEGPTAKVPADAA